MDSFDLDAAQAEGYVAGEHGAPRSHNPYTGGHFLHNAWNEGWDEAWSDFEADRLASAGPSGVEIFVAIVMFALFTVCICRGTIWLLEFLA